MESTTAETPVTVSISDSLTIAQAKKYGKWSIQLHFLLAGIVLAGLTAYISLSLAEDASGAGALFFVFIIAAFYTFCFLLVSAIFLPFVYRGKVWAMICAASCQVLFFFSTLGFGILPALLEHNIKNIIAMTLVLLVWMVVFVRMLRFMGKAQALWKIVEAKTS